MLFAGFQCWLVKVIEEAVEKLHSLLQLSGNIGGEQGWRSGESTHLPPMWPRFDSRCGRDMWVEFVVSSCPCSEGFSPGTSVFLPPQKPTFPNSNLTWKQWREEPLRGFH